MNKINENSDGRISADELKEYFMNMDEYGTETGLDLAGIQRTITSLACVKAEVKVKDDEECCEGLVKSPGQGMLASMNWCREEPVPCVEAEIKVKDDEECCEGLVKTPGQGMFASMNWCREAVLPPCVCVSTWTDEASEGSCGTEQIGCPAEPCDGDKEGRWCLTTEENCANVLEGGSWVRCDDTTPVFGDSSECVVCTQAVPQCEQGCSDCKVTPQTCETCAIATCQESTTNSEVTMPKTTSTLPTSTAAPGTSESAISYVVKSKTKPDQTLLASLKESATKSFKDAK